MPKPVEFLLRLAVKNHSALVKPAGHAGPGSGILARQQLRHVSGPEFVKHGTETGSVLIGEAELPPVLLLNGDVNGRPGGVDYGL